MTTDRVDSKQTCLAFFKTSSLKSFPEVHHDVFQVAPARVTRPAGFVSVPPVVRLPGRHVEGSLNFSNFTFAVIARLAKHAAVQLAYQRVTKAGALVQPVHVLRHHVFQKLVRVKRDAREMRVRRRAPLEPRHRHVHPFRPHGPHPVLSSEIGNPSRGAEPGAGV
eukprot:CAMPEP_0117635854 /NCGR_PEP_ID=MMETSP0802-20121206/6454_1 /TAXON_ID=38833 /ORGANISM="Micromonas sp., Strain CCMP2099" /LENGTH=164 /DNA_ID=CAMNT_0005440625 /DNA_START=346 /DNA_END=839 /DNA_ORIENTATION=-